MTKTFGAMLLGAAAAAAMGLTGPAAAQTGVAAAAHPAGTIVVSCYRGPLRGVYWDRPDVAFTDSLRAAGYDLATSLAIGERVCRDPALVGDAAAMAAEVEVLLAEAPRRDR